MRRQSNGDKGPDHRLMDPEALPIPSVRSTLTLAFAMAITMYGFSVEIFSPLKVSLADISIAAALGYTILHVTQVRINSVTLLVILFAGSLLLAGAVTAWQFAYFDELNFAINFVRIVAIVAIMALLPVFFRSIGFELIVRAVLWALRANAVVLLIDVVGWLPAALSPSPPELSRPTGFFTEPGWYSGSLSLMLFCLLFAEVVLRQRFVTVFDLALFLVSIVVSTGFRGITLLPFTILILLTMDLRMRNSRTAIAVPTAFTILLIGAQFFPDSPFGRNVEHVGERTVRVISVLFDRVPAVEKLVGVEEQPKVERPTDHNAGLRIDATSGFARTMVAEKLFFGIGLGGNLINGYIFFTESDEISRFFSEKYKKYADRYLIGTGANGSGMVSSFDNILFAGGPLALLAFVSIIACLVLKPDTRVFGFSFLVFCLLWGAIFQLFVWVMVALAVALGELESERDQAP